MTTSTREAMAASLAPTLVVTAFVAAGALATTGCRTRREPIEALFTVPGLDLTLPRQPGWRLDDSIPALDPAKGGIVARLVRDDGVPGSPRIDVVIEPLKTRPSTLDTFLDDNLREMGRIEAAGQIRILRVDKQPRSVGPWPGYRVYHDYTVGAGSSQVAITQVSAFLVIDARGVAITAAGRTELFHPLAESVDTILGGIAPRGAGSSSRRQVSNGGPAARGPIDLGRIEAKDGVPPAEPDHTPPN